MLCQRLRKALPVGSWRLRARRDADRSAAAGKSAQRLRRLTTKTSNRAPSGLRAA